MSTPRPSTRAPARAGSFDRALPTRHRTPAAALARMLGINIKADVAWRLRHRRYAAGPTWW